jgi:hypothetical protein
VTSGDDSENSEQVMSEPEQPPTLFFQKYGVTKPYDLPKSTRNIKKDRFIFKEHFAPNHKVMVQRSNISNIKER